MSTVHHICRHPFQQGLVVELQALQNKDLESLRTQRRFVLRSIDHYKDILVQRPGEPPLTEGQRALYQRELDRSERALNAFEQGHPQVRRVEQIEHILVDDPHDPPG